MTLGDLFVVVMIPFLFGMIFTINTHDDREMHAFGIGLLIVSLVLLGIIAIIWAQHNNIVIQPH